MNETPQLTEEPIDPLTDTGKIYQVVRRAIQDAEMEKNKKFDWIKFIRTVANNIVSEIDARMK